MAILSVTRVWHGETWSDGKKGAREYEELYRVVTDDPNTTALAVRVAVPVYIGDFYSDDPAARCTARSAKRHQDSREVWEVTVTYAYEPGDEDEVENPLAKPVLIRWTAAQYTKPCVKDRNDEAVVNSAGDYFDPPPEIEDVRWQVTAQVNWASVPAAILNYAGRVNSAAFTIDGVSILAGKARVAALDISERQIENDIPFRTVTITYELRAEGFDLELLDQGFRIKDGSDLKDILIEDEDGNMARPSSPVLLDGAGNQLSNPSPANAVFLTYEALPQAAFSGLPGVVG